MKITKDVRGYAKEKNVEAEKALAVGMAERLRSLSQRGAGFNMGIYLMGQRNIIDFLQ
ncbi:MAG: hypothetical protein ACKVQW_12295 [Pyrinomonadaceae bacterium]